jgi:hypothetical protein
MILDLFLTCTKISMSSKFIEDSVSTSALPTQENEAYENSQRNLPSLPTSSFVENPEVSSTTFNDDPPTIEKHELSFDMNETGKDFDHKKVGIGFLSSLI